MLLITTSSSSGANCLHFRKRREPTTLRHGTLYIQLDVEMVLLCKIRELRRLLSTWSMQHPKRCPRVIQQCVGSGMCELRERGLPTLDAVAGPVRSTTKRFASVARETLKVSWSRLLRKRWLNPWPRSQMAWHKLAKSSPVRDMGAASFVLLQLAT